MGTKRVFICDLTGREGPESEFGKLLVYDHPEVAGAVILDVCPDEVAPLEPAQLVEVEYVPLAGSAEPRRRFQVDLATFNGLHRRTDGDMGTLLRARYPPQVGRQPAPPVRRPPRRAAEDAAGRRHDPGPRGLPATG